MDDIWNFHHWIVHITAAGTAQNAHRHTVDHNWKRIHQKCWCTYCFESKWGHCLHLESRKAINEKRNRPRRCLNVATLSTRCCGGGSRSSKSQLVLMRGKETSKKMIKNHLVSSSYGDEDNGRRDMRRNRRRCHGYRCCCHRGWGTLLWRRQRRQCQR